MSDNQLDVCNDPLAFPMRPDNRPGLPRIAYRAGTYATIREAMFDRLNRDLVLKAWTHRGSDDPGIALLEGAAILGDILSFYQDVYANEAYLRTSAWRESVADLVRLLGYRLAPGVGGRGDFAFEVRGDAAVVVPPGFPVSAQVTGLEGQADFQTSEQLTAYPWLSRFSLYRPTRTEAITPATPELRLTTAGAVTLQPGDKLLLGAPDSPDDPSELGNAEVAIVESVRQRHGETLVTLKGRLQRTTSAPILAGYKVGRSFRHFGHNAPAEHVYVAYGNTWSAEVDYGRMLGSKTSASKYPARPAIDARDMLLADAVDDLPLGAPLVCQIPSRSTETITQVRRIARLRKDSFSWGNLTSEATVVRLDRELRFEKVFMPTGVVYEREDPGVLMMAQAQMRMDQSEGLAPGVLASVNNIEAVQALSQGPMTIWGGGIEELTPLVAVGVVVDNTGALATYEREYSVRSLHFHETLSPLLTFEARPEPRDESSRRDLGFVGTATEASVLPGRRLLLQRAGHEPQSVVVQSVETPAAGPEDRRMLRRLRVDKRVDYADFPLESPLVTVFGNVAGATQGKQEREAVLGNGDARAGFQTFKLPKSPLTYLATVGEAPPETPQVEVFVNGIRWSRVDSFFTALPEDRVYIVREDAEGSSWVQFGDGKAGARLPSGVGNVVARFRSGNAAYGPIVPETTPQAGTRLDRLDRIQLPGVVSGGAGPETADNARAAAPGKVQALGRLVSIADYEAEALSLSGVSTVSGAWTVEAGTPSVVLTVLMDTGRQAELTAVEHSLSAASTAIGPARFPVVVRSGWRRYFYVDVTVVRAPRMRDDVVLAAVREALAVAGVPGNDRDGAGGRRFGQTVYATEIEAAIQNVEGVVWTRVNVLDASWLPGAGHDADGHTVDPETLERDATGGSVSALTCNPDTILALHTTHLAVHISTGGAS